MPSMAHGDDQRGGLQAHRPEVCSLAQGFKLGKVEDGTLATAYRNIELRRYQWRASRVGKRRATAEFERERGV